MSRYVRLRVLGLLLAGLQIAGAALAQQSAASAPAGAAPPLELVVLGSGGPGATGRAGAGYVVLVDGTPRIFVDAGPGTLARLGEAKLALGQADIVLLTHLHVDHAGELPGLFKARAVSGRGAIEFKIFGPDGRRAAGADEADFPSTGRLIELLFGKQGAFGYLKDFAAPLSFKVTDIAATQRTPRTLLSQDGLSISAVAGHHRDAPAVIYRIDHGGQSISFSGDIDASGLAGLQRIAQDTGLLVFNSVVLDPPGSPPQLYELHTPPRAIGELAAAAKAGKLLLSHLSPALDAQREAVRASVARSYGGALLFAEDGMRLAP